MMPRKDENMAAAMKVTGIQKKFEKTEVLKGVSFSLEKGHVLSVIGPSGGGKTTLLRCITMLETPDAGKITVGSETVFDASDKTKLSAKERRRRQLKMGLVFQAFHLFPQYNVMQNVTLACRLLARDQEGFSRNKREIYGAIDEKARGIIAKVGLSDKLEAYPCQLSGGQQQRVAIARALALDPEILCFDEPTSALDPELTAEVLGVIRELASEHMTMVVVTHEMRFAHDIADKVIFMDGGVAAAEGTPDEIFDNPSDAHLKSFIGSFLK